MVKTAYKGIIWDPRDGATKNYRRSFGHGSRAIVVRPFSLLIGILFVASLVSELPFYYNEAQEVLYMFSQDSLNSLDIDLYVCT